MKKILLLMLLIAATQAVRAQDDEKAPYLKFHNVPPFKLLLPDSVSYYTKADLPKKKALMLMLFSPMCEHCKHETAELLRNIDKFEDVQILMATSNPFDSMKVFIENFGLAAYKNIVVTYDPQFFLISYYQLHNLPFIAFYNKKQEFISVFEGNIPIDKALEELKK
jgi:thioredoxin-related protein